MNKTQLIEQAKAQGISVPTKATKAEVEAMLAAANPTVVKVERKASKRGRKPVEKPGMAALANSWNQLSVDDTVILPDYEGSGEDHAKLTLARYHFRKYASANGLTAGVDYTIEGHPEHGATITRLR